MIVDVWISTSVRIRLWQQSASTAVLTIRAGEGSSLALCVTSVNSVSSVISVNSVNSVTSVNSVNSVTSVNSVSRNSVGIVLTGTVLAQC